MCLYSYPSISIAGRHQKGPHRRCFKMSSFFQLAEKMTGAVSSRYRTGLSHHLRTSGHPQARATLGKIVYRTKLYLFQSLFYYLFIIQKNNDEKHQSIPKQKSPSSFYASKKDQTTFSFRNICPPNKL